MIGDGGSVTHSLSHVSACGVYVARLIAMLNLVTGTVLLTTFLVNRTVPVTRFGALNFILLKYIFK